MGGLILLGSLSDETWQDSEPNLAVNPANPLHIAASAFTRDPMGGPNAPIYVSADGGRTWSLNFIVPSQAMTGDITLKFSPNTNVLYAGILRVPATGTRLNILRTKNFLGPSQMSVLVDRAGVDQPWVEAQSLVASSGVARDRVYVGSNDFQAPGGRTASVDRSLSAAASGAFKTLRVEPRGTSGQNGPQTRLAGHADGTIYATYYGWRSFDRVTREVVADVVVARDDNWAAGATTFSSLRDAADGLPGAHVARSVQFQWNHFLGQQRTGGHLSLAVDPRNSSTVYLAWGDRRSGAYTLHLRRSGDRGQTWSASDLRTQPSAINGALAVNGQGVVGLLFQELRQVNGVSRWITQFETSANQGATWSNAVLATVPAQIPARTFDPYIGDYADLQAVGNDFHGVFSTGNEPDQANFPQGVRYQRNHNFSERTLLGLNGSSPVAVSIDPFFFRAVI